MKQAAYDGGWGDEEESMGSFYKNTELELLRLNNKLLDLERRMGSETNQIRDYMQKATKEQQFYIETLH